MNLVETKKYFEDIFEDGWLETAVHYVGMEFDGSQHDRWVNPVYKPLRSTPNGISESTSISMGQLYIVCWADNDGDAMELADSVVAFISTDVDKTLFRHRGHDVIDHGWNESNKVFVMLSFTFEQFNGTC